MIAADLSAVVDAVPKKTCSRCGKVKPLDQYHRQPAGPQGRHSWCRVCANQYSRENKKRNYLPAQKRKWQLQTRYGLTVAAFDAILRDQGGVCAVCAQIMKRPCVDHDHTTGAVRGILCHRCNIGIALMDRPTLASLASAYLARGVK